MKASLLVWGIILIVGFYASDLLVRQGFSEVWLWIAWAVILNAGHYAVGKTMKKVSRGMQMTWMNIGAFGLIATLAVVSGIVSLSVAFLMALWLLLVGAALFAGGIENKDSLGLSSGVILVIGAVFTPAFGNSYFLAGSLFMGLLTLLMALWIRG